MKKPLAVVATLALALLGIAVVPTAAFAAGTVTVTVEDASHAPILGAQVTARQPNGGITLSAVIGSPGAYMNSSLSAGTYTLIVTAPGYARQFYAGTAISANATPVVVTEGGTQTLAFTLDPESVISGTITDHDGQPFQALVAVYSDNDGGLAIDSMYSDAGTGQYSFPSLAHGDYRIAVQTNVSSTAASQWYVQANSEADATVIHLSGASATADVQLAHAATLAGTTKNVLGTDVSIDVTASPTGQTAGSQSGSYSLGGLLPDTYSFTTSDQGDFFAVQGTDAIAIGAGETITHDFVVTPRLLDDAEMLSSSDEVAPLSGPSTVAAGGTYTWTVTAPDDGDLYVVLYSTPVLLATLPGAGATASLTVTIPASTPAGAHDIAVWAFDQSGNLGIDFPSRSYFPITVTAAGLAATGVDPAPPVGLALVLLLTGAAALAITRRRGAVAG